MMNAPERTIGFVGTGRMATALAGGLVDAEFVRSDSIRGYDTVPEALNQFAQTTGGRPCANLKELVSGATLIVIAVKPQQMSAALSSLHQQFEREPTADPLLISLAAGVSLKTLSAELGLKRRVVRVMPNTPCLVQSSAAGFALGGTATDDDAQIVAEMLETVGIAYRLPEAMLDAVTGLSGSGPAYVFQIIEALSDGGVRAGLPREIATRLAAQTVAGAAKMVLETGEHPAALKDAVASPGGTTIAGLHELERAGVRGALMNAVVAATEKSRELGQT